MSKVRFGIAWVVLVLIFAGTFRALGVGVAEGQAANTPAAATASAFAVADPSTSLELRANVLPIQRAELNFTSRSAGSEATVAEVLVNEGDTVNQGTPLVRLDTRDLELRVQEAQAALTNAQAMYERLRLEADVTRLQAELETARSQTDANLAQLRARTDAVGMQAEANNARSQGRGAAAASLDVGAQLQLESVSTIESSAQVQQEKLNAIAAAQATASTATMNAAQAQVQQAEVALKRTQLGLELATLRAPMDGTIVEMNLTVGEAPNVAQPAVVLANLTTWQLETNALADLTASRIHVGDRVSIIFDSIPGLELSGKVTHIKPVREIDPNATNAAYTVIVMPDQQDERLRWNMAATVTVMPSR